MLAGEIAFTYMDGRNAVQAGFKGVDVVILAGVANRLVFSFMSRPEIKNLQRSQREENRYHTHWILDP